MGNNKLENLKNKILEAHRNVKDTQLSSASVSVFVCEIKDFSSTKTIFSVELRDDTRYHVYGQVLFGTMDISEFTRVCMTEQELLDFVNTLAELPSKLDKKVKNFAYTTVRKMIEEN